MCVCVFCFCFVCLFVFCLHFWKPLKFGWGLPKWKLSTGKRSILRWEKTRESDFAPREKIFKLCIVKTVHRNDQPVDIRPESDFTSKIITVRVFIGPI